MSSPDTVDATRRTHLAGERTELAASPSSFRISAWVPSNTAISQEQVSA